MGGKKRKEGREWNRGECKKNTKNEKGKLNEIGIGKKNLKRGEKVFMGGKKRKEVREQKKQSCQNLLGSFLILGMRRSSKAVGAASLCY